MLRQNQAKTAALVYVAFCIIISVACTALGGLPVEKVAICKDCTVLARLSYSFFHASIMHTLINGWCLLSLVFIYRISIWHLIIAYCIAISFPVNTIGEVFGTSLVEIPTVGSSAICFALMALASYQTQRKLLFHAWVASFIAIGYLLPYLCSICGIHVAAPNNAIHIYSYIAGLLVGFLDSPAPWQK